nr:unnamed protein product [Digitaria exilis]
MDLRGWQIASIKQVLAFGGEDEDTDTALKFAYESLSLPHPRATPDAPLAAACAGWCGAPGDGGVDRISCLPDEILRNVVSCLPVKDAARTGVLASRWRGLWRAMPLVFSDANLLQGCREDPLWRPGLENTLGVTNEVSDILAAHPGPFRCVHISCCYLDMNREKIKGWLKLVADKGVQELAFINRPWPLDLRLPTTLFSCTSLTHLHIGAWKLPDTATLPSAVAFPQLQELFLSLITMKDRDLAFLLDISPVLEVLTIIASQTDVHLCLVSRSLRCLQLGMSSLGDIAVADAPRLERFFLLMTRRNGRSKSSMIKICNAPNLRMLGYWPLGQHELQIGNTVIEVGTKMSRSTIIPSVKILALHVHFESRNEVKTVPSLLKCFPNVETLHIQSVKVDRPTGNVSLKFWLEACPVECVQHVKKLVIHGFQGNKNEHAFIKFIGERACPLVYRSTCSLPCPLPSAVVVSSPVSTVHSNQFPHRLLHGSAPDQNPRLVPAPAAMDLARQCAFRCLPDRAVTRAGALSAALLRMVASRLPAKHAGRFTALSPRWRRVWRSVPLAIDDTELAIAGVRETIPAVDHLLAAHPGPFRSVRLTFCFFGGFDGESELARWPRLLADRGVRELFFINPPPPIDMALPADILRCAELRRLYLGFWQFPDTRCLPNGVGVFPRLREFVLLNTRIEDRDLDHMLASSPALETLAVVLSYGLPRHVRVRGQNLRCVLFWLSMADELAVVDAPRLERLLMWLTTTCGLDEPDSDSDSDDEPTIRVRIASAPALKVVGYLDTKLHQLQIGDTVIEDDTEVSPSFMIPSVKILALRANFRVFTEVQMLSSFLRCFPNVETLHVEFAMADRPTGKHYGKFLSKLSPIECLRSHTKKVVLHEFRGDLSEVVFIQHLTQRVNQLQHLTIVLSKDILLSVDNMRVVLRELARPPWASKSCTVLLVGPKHAWNFHRASDLSIDDPFDSEHGEEFFCFTKEGDQTVWKHP